MVVNIMKRCKICNDIIPSYHNSNICQSCNTYYKNHPEGEYPLPPKGEVHYAKNGDVICHICGRAYRKLGSHIRNKHKLAQNDYRDMFGLYHNTKLSNNEYISIMQTHNDKNKDTVVNQNLIKSGFNTRMTDIYNTPGRKFQYKIKNKTLL